MKKLERAFFSRDSITVAKEILGKVMVYKTSEQRIAVRIVEAEAYMGVEDKAAHSYGGRRTARVEVMYGDAGMCYVFMIYGMHCCFNIVTAMEGIPQAVLIRAAEPLAGLDYMADNRFEKPYDQLTKGQRRSLTNGPGKLCKALSVDRSFNGVDLCDGQLFFEEDNGEPFSIVETKRVGIDYAEEAKDYPWRFYIEGNKYVSVK